ncbi:molybdopterin molybdotransferase MoeA [Jannaschia rubra]|uniref:molybdopterin molybdotransferase MoeA n=1 Tax=Jannaschia rubra TaxID=282197 RepID=UPI0024926ED8|nr:molybdopterin molybdotransferase MoeA [Jannaschia rubra]
MISVEEASAALLALVSRLPVERVPLRAARGRVLSGPVRARHAQPSFAASAMDGYAIAVADPVPGQRFRIKGESAAGHPFTGRCDGDGAIRIFTGAPVPEGAVRVIIQEDVARDGDVIVLTDTVGSGTHIRPEGGDFDAGATHDPQRPLGSRDIALLAAMGHGKLSVIRRPEVAIIMTGDELRPPGTLLATGQIAASNGYGLAAMLEDAGAQVRLLPIAADTPESLGQALDLAAGADLVLTIGGASVGDHDLVAATAGAAGLELSFHKVAMRPGKPLLAGKLKGSTLVGLPGNPVSSMVCGLIFILPLLRSMLGLPPGVPRRVVPLAVGIGPNGPREHYMRATLRDGRAQPHARQDSSLLSILADADVLLVRPPRDPERGPGDPVDVIDLPR